MSNAIINHTAHYSSCPRAGENKKSRAYPDQTVQHNEKGKKKIDDLECHLYIFGILILQTQNVQMQSPFVSQQGVRLRFGIL